MSYITRHRPICAVLQQLRDATSDPLTLELLDEARSYAESMSAALVRYKEALVLHNIHI